MMEPVPKVFVTAFLDMMETTVRTIPMNVVEVLVKTEEFAQMGLTLTLVSVRGTTDIIVRMNVSKDDVFQKYILPKPLQQKLLYFEK